MIKQAYSSLGAPNDVCGLVTSFNFLCVMYCLLVIASISRHFKQLDLAGNYCTGSPSWTKNGIVDKAQMEHRSAVTNNI